MPAVKEEEEPEEEDEEEMGHAETYAEYMPIKCMTCSFVISKGLNVSRANLLLSIVTNTRKQVTIWIKSKGPEFVEIFVFYSA